MARSGGPTDGEAPVDQLLAALSMGQAVYQRLDSQTKEATGLTLPQATVLYAIDANSKRATVSNLARTLYRASHTMSAMVKSLEARGFVTRTRDIRDRRKVWVGLTPVGQRHLLSYQNLLRKSLAQHLPNGRTKGLLAEIRALFAALIEAA